MTPETNSYTLVAISHLLKVMSTHTLEKKSDLTDKIKQDFFPVVAVSVL